MDPVQVIYANYMYLEDGFHHARKLFISIFNGNTDTINSLH